MATLDEAISDYLFSQYISWKNIPDYLEYNGKYYRVNKQEVSLCLLPEWKFTYIKVEIFDEKGNPVFLLKEEDKVIKWEYVVSFDIVKKWWEILLKIKKSFYSREWLHYKTEYFTETGEKIEEPNFLTKIKLKLSELFCSKTY